MNDVTSTPITSPYILELFNKIERIGEEYGLYMKLLNFHNKKSVMGSGIYVVAGLSEIPEDVNPYEICKRNERNRQLFYPKDFAVKLTPDNCMIMFDKVLEYCGKAELIQNLYREYEANIPDCLRNSEVVGLENWNDGRRSGTLGSDFRYRCLKGLKEFFKNEKKKSESFREERRFWRSEKYDEDAGKLQRMKAHSVCGMSLWFVYHFFKKRAITSNALKCRSIYISSFMIISKPVIRK